MVINEFVEDWLPEIIYQNFVMWPIPDGSGKRSVIVLTRDILKYLQDKGHKATISDQVISAAMNGYVIAPKIKHEGLNEDIAWRKAQIKRNGQNLRGYRLDFEGESKERAFVILKQIVAKENNPEEAFDENILKNNRPM